MNAKKGFTLIEMLVVIGIIAALSAALAAGYGRVVKSAQRAKAQETVSNAAAALGLLIQRDGKWPQEVRVNGGADGEGKGMTVAVAKILGEKKLMGVTMRGEQPAGTDRCGIVDPWGVAALKKSASAGEGTKVPTGGTVRDHIIYYAVDLDDDGITEATVGGETVRVRATAIAWGAGADGKIAPLKERGRSDDTYSWRRGQEVKSEGK